MGISFTVKKHGHTKEHEEGNGSRAQPIEGIGDIISRGPGLLARRLAHFPLSIGAKCKDMTPGGPVSLAPEPIETHHSCGRSDTPVDANLWAPRLVNSLLVSGIRGRASDLHLEPGEDEVKVRYRVDGRLREGSPIPLKAYPSVVGRIKVLANMSVVSHHKPQDGHMVFSSSGDSVDIRVTTVPTVRGERIALRFLDYQKTASGLEGLGFDASELELYRSFLVHGYGGMVLVAGPTGSGKTTTLYSTVKELDLTSTNVMTLEDPVECLVPQVSQVQVRPRMGLTFASALKAFLRQDPDVLMVGEIRDGETARVACQAALSGHLVLSSVHALDGVSALARLVDMGVSPYLVASSVKGVVSQRLVGRICTGCRKEYLVGDADRAYLDDIGGASIESLARGMGCNACGGTGYSGRTGIFEVLALSGELRSLITQGGFSEGALAGASRPAMANAALKKLAGHETTLEEVCMAVSPGLNREQVSRHPGVP